MVLGMLVVRIMCPQKSLSLIASRYTGENPGKFFGYQDEALILRICAFPRPSLCRYENGYYLGLPSRVSKRMQDCSESSPMMVRGSYNKAREIKIAQDEYCAKALSGDWNNLAPEFPEDYQWEALVDVLRGRVKVR